MISSFVLSEILSLEEEEEEEGGFFTVKLQEYFPKKTKELIIG
jgi:hypothetical protein